MTKLNIELLNDIASKSERISNLLLTGIDLEEEILKKLNPDLLKSLIKNVFKKNAKKIRQISLQDIETKEEITQLYKFIIKYMPKNAILTIRSLKKEIIELLMDYLKGYEGGLGISHLSAQETLLIINQLLKHNNIISILKLQSINIEAANIITHYLRLSTNNINVISFCSLTSEVAKVILNILKIPNQIRAISVSKLCEDTVEEIIKCLQYNYSIINQLIIQPMSNDSIKKISQSLINHPNKINSVCFDSLFPENIEQFMQHFTNPKSKVNVLVTIHLSLESMQSVIKGLKMQNNTIAQLGLFETSTIAIEALSRELINTSLTMLGLKNITEKSAKCLMDNLIKCPHKIDTLMLLNCPEESIKIIIEHLSTSSKSIHTIVLSKTLSDLSLMYILDAYLQLYKNKINIEVSLLPSVWQQRFVNLANIYSNNQLISKQNDVNINLSNHSKSTSQPTTFFSELQKSKLPARKRPKYETASQTCYQNNNQYEKKAL